MSIPKDWTLYSTSINFAFKQTLILRLFMSKGIYIIGTDTGGRKTVVSAGLMHLLLAEKHRALILSLSPVARLLYKRRYRSNWMQCLLERLPDLSREEKYQRHCFLKMRWRRIWLRVWNRCHDIVLNQRPSPIFERTL